MRPAVLIVDDDAALTQTIHDILELDGIDAVATGDPAALSNLVASSKPDVVVIDLMLAATTGVELAAELRNGPLSDTPLIAMSSSPFMCEIAEESNLFATVLPKPLDFDELATLILDQAETEGDERT